MEYLASIKGLRRGPKRNQLIADLLDLVHLSEDKHRAVSSYSGGMKQRFGIAQALMSNPSLIILDEPTAGLDPEERVRFLNIINEAGQDRIVIFSTHIVEDVASLCQNFSIIKEGQIITSQTPQSAIEGIKDNIYLRESNSQDLPGLILTELLINGKRFQSIFLEDKDSPEGSLLPKTVTLEDFYLYQMKKV